NLLGTALSPQNDSLSSATGPDDIFTDQPFLAALAFNGGPTQTMALLPGSPAIGAGDPGHAGTTAQNGVIRTGPVDIGAYQTPAGTSLVIPNTSDSGAGSLRQAITKANSGGGGTITFAIPTSDPGYNASTGVWTITPSYVGGGISLPVITSPTILDGWSQGGLGYRGSPLI